MSGPEETAKPPAPTANNPASLFPTEKNQKNKNKQTNKQKKTFPQSHLHGEGLDGSKCLDSPFHSARALATDVLVHFGRRRIHKPLRVLEKLLQLRRGRHKEVRKLCPRPLDAVVNQVRKVSQRAHGDTAAYWAVGIKQRGGG